MTMSRKKILVVDGSNISYRAYHAMARMSYKGQGTAIQWGFLNILGAHLGSFKPDQVVVCWDQGNNPKRVEVLPTYRMRDKDRVDFDAEDFHRQKEALQELLYHLGIPQLTAPQCEADDFIYEVTRRVVQKTKMNVIIVSGDKDFRQLVSNRVFIQDDKIGLITPINFKKNFGIEPQQYADYLCLLGDSSDKIPGVKGIGDKTAIKILNEMHTVPIYLKEVPTSKWCEPIKEIYYRNRQLINLQYFGELHGPHPLVYYKDEKKPKKNITEYKRLCAKFGINKFQETRFINSVPTCYPKN